MSSVPWQANKAKMQAAKRRQDCSPGRKPRGSDRKAGSPWGPKETFAERKSQPPATILSPLWGCEISCYVDPGLAPWAALTRGRFEAHSKSTRHQRTLPAHVPDPFDILGHRADDLVVPDPGPEHRSRLSGRISSLPSGAEPYEGRLLQRTPRQGLTPRFTPAHSRS